MKNKMIIKAPILMVCFFLLFSLRANAQIDQKINEKYKECTMTIDANKNIYENGRLADASGICRNYVQGYYLEYDKTFSVQGAISHYVNYDGEQFEIYIEGKGESILTVHLIETEKSSEQSIRRELNKRNIKENPTYRIDIQKDLNYTDREKDAEIRKAGTKEEAMLLNQNEPNNTKEIVKSELNKDKEEISYSKQSKEDQNSSSNKKLSKKRTDSDSPKMFNHLIIIVFMVVAVIFIILSLVIKRRLHPNVNIKSKKGVK